MRSVTRRTLNRRLVPVLIAGLVTSGCAAMRMQMRYGKLDSQTAMSESVFLVPGSALPPTVFVQETCSADSPVTVRPAIDREFAAAGYEVVEYLEDATYVLQINHLRLAEMELSKDQTLGDALSSAFAAGFAAGLAADVASGSGDLAGGMGLAVGAVGFIVDAQTRHIAHLLTTDVLLTETVVSSDGALDVRDHRTQVVSGASKVNLRLSQSLPVIVAGMGQALAHLLPPRTPPGG